MLAVSSNRKGGSYEGRVGTLRLAGGMGWGVVRPLMKGLGPGPGLVEQPFQDGGKSRFSYDEIRPWRGPWRVWG